MSVEPLSRHVSQSCGRHTAAVASACAGSWSASHRSLVAVIAATGTTPIRFAHSPAPAELVDKFGGRGARPSVVPQQRISNYVHRRRPGTPCRAAGHRPTPPPRRRDPPRRRCWPAARTTTAADRPRCRRDAATMRTARSHRYPRRRRPPCRTGWTSRFPQRVPRLRSYSGVKAHGHRFTAGVGDGGVAPSRADDDISAP